MSIDREPRLLNKSFSVKQYQGSLKDKVKQRKKKQEK